MKPRRPHLVDPLDDIVAAMSGDPLAADRARYAKCTRHLVEAGTTRPKYPWAEAVQIGRAAEGFDE